MTTTLKPAAQALADQASTWGSGPFGILADDMGFLLDVTVSPRGWVHPTAGGKAYRLLCAEIVERTYPESSETYTSRCGQPVTDGASPFCEAHHPGVDIHALCEHQMSAWLCSGPNHF
jgi:hypothetical protein